MLKIRLWLLALLLGACASPSSYVVLLANEDGSIGKVQVNGREGATLLEKHREGAQFAGPAGKSFPVSAEQLAEHFGAALAASPKLPVTFLLYFETGGAKLTRDSADIIPLVIAEIARRPAPDVSIIGHTESVGSDETNTRVGLVRARAIGEMIRSARITPERISLESHGKRNLLVKTPDNTAEGLNRRVEVTIR